MNVDKCHKALLSLAEEFRTKMPPDLKSCMQCLLAVLNLPVSPNIIAKTNFQLGSLIFKYTHDISIAQTYLERAYEQSQTPELTPIRLQVVALLVDIYITHNQRQSAKQILTRAINDTTTRGGGHYNLYWHYRFLLKLSQLNLKDGDYTTANNLLSIGAQTASAAADSFTQILFLLSKAMVVMIAKKGYVSLNPAQQNQNQPIIQGYDAQLTEAFETSGNSLEALQGDPSRKEALKIFYLVLQVCNQLNKVHNKSAKQGLRLLQQSIQNLRNISGPDTLAIGEAQFISQNMSENFTWLSKPTMNTLVYVISVLHSMQCGFLDKAQSYSESAFMMIERVRAQSPEPDPLLETFHIVLLEHMSMCHLVMGSRSTAIRQIVQAIQLCYRGGHRYQRKHRGALHTLLGLYAMSMNLLDDAEFQFSRVLNDEGACLNLKVMAMLNLALSYLQDNVKRYEKRAEIDNLLDQLMPDNLNPLSYCLKAAAFYVHGLKALVCQENHHDAKRNLRETLKLANGEDLNRLTSCSLVLLGEIFNKQEIPNDSLNVVTPGLRLARKCQDIHVQLWASSVLKDTYSRDVNSQHHIEATNMHTNFANRTNEDKMQSSVLQEHNYIQWNDF